MAKALPREWLSPSAEAVAVLDATSRYGRVSYVLNATLDPSSHAYTVAVNLTLSPQIVHSPPPGW